MFSGALPNENQSHDSVLQNQGESEPVSEKRLAGSKSKWIHWSGSVSRATGVQPAPAPTPGAAWAAEVRSPPTPQPGSSWVRKRGVDAPTWRCTRQRSYQDSQPEPLIPACLSLLHPAVCVSVCECELECVSECECTCNCYDQIRRLEISPKKQ